MGRMALFVAVTAVALPLFGQTPGTSPATDGTSPALLTNVIVAPGDSRLVRAAKLAVARRRQFKSNGPVWHVDDSMVAHHAVPPANSTTTLSAASALPGSPAPGAASARTIATGSGPSGAQLMEKKAALQREQARMSEEYDQPYAGDVPEDVSERRLTEIPGQLKAIDQKLQAMPPPSPPPQ